MQVSNDQVVSIAYTLTNDEGDVLDQGSQQEPLAYLHGHGNLVVGVEEVLEGKAIGDSISCDVPPEKGYGDYDPQLDLIVPLDAFPAEEHDSLQAGVRFQAPHPQQQERVLLYTILGVEEDQVRVTGNHPLAGQTLHFDIEVMGIRPASESELQHGHVH